MSLDKEELVRTLVERCQALEKRLQVVTDAIKYVVTQQFDDLCWLDVYRNLAALIHVEFEPRLLERQEFVRNCGRYYDHLATGCTYQPNDLRQRLTKLCEEWDNRLQELQEKPGAFLELEAALHDLREEMTR